MERTRSSRRWRSHEEGLRSWKVLLLACVLAALAVARGQPGGGGGGGGGGGSGTPCPAGNGRIVTFVSATATEYSTFLGGCPQYSPYNQSTGNTPAQKNKTLTFRRTPVLSSTIVYVGRKASGDTTNTQMIMGYIGFAVNGVAIYNDANAEGADAYITEGHTLDGCRGHADPSGTYHYHSEPQQGCVYTDTAGAHSPLYGIMLDSIPIYGALGDGGVAPTNLDECGGHTDTTYAFYHYHVAANLQPPYIIKCFKGCVFSNNGNPAVPSSIIKTDSTCARAAQQYDYSALFASSPFTTVAPPPPPSPPSPPPRPPPPPSTVSPPPPPSTVSPPPPSTGAAASSRWRALLAALPAAAALALLKRGLA